MRWVHILVEGQTEETFVRDVLRPHLLGVGVHPNAILAATKRAKKGPHFKGGIVSYARVKSDLGRLLGDTSVDAVTTMIDFYGLPTDFPGYNTLPGGSCYQRAAHLEQALDEDIDHPKFIPYLAIHEFEAMLFAAPEQIAKLFAGEKVVAELKATRARFESPEEIDEECPPSRRIKEFLPGYQKALYGPLIALEIGLEGIRAECRHFSGWLEKLEALGEN
jgi:hypothetical protein